MSIIAENKGKVRELIPAGNYICRCYQIVEMGLITESYMGEPKTSQKVMITWELPEETRVFNPEKGPQPMVISQEFTLSLNEKSNLRKILESWRGKGFTDEECKGFDISKLIGVPGFLNLIHKPKQDGGMKQVIASITPLPKSVKAPKQVNPSVVISYDNFDEAAFNLLPDFLKAKMKTSEEYQSLMNPQAKKTDSDYEDLINGTLEIEDNQELPF